MGDVPARDLRYVAGGLVIPNHLRPCSFAESSATMKDEALGERDRQLNWLAARLRVPAGRIAETAAWQAYAGPSDSLDLIELAFRLEAELCEREPEAPRPSCDGGWRLAPAGPARDIRGMDPEREDYADYGSRSRLPTPADLAGCVLIMIASAVIVAGFVAMVALLDRAPLQP
jgi:hypothetical protein